MNQAGIRKDRRKRSSFWPGDAQDPRERVPRPCRFNPDIFTSGHWADRRVAKMSCQGCPVQQPCLDHGLKLDDLVDQVASGGTMFGADGIYGGLLRWERLKIRKGRS